MEDSFCSKIVLLFMLFLAGLSTHAQTKRIDSLKLEIGKTTDPDKRLATLLVLCSERNSLSPDTLLRYATEAKTIASGRQDSSGIAMAEYFIALNLMTRGLIDSCLKIADQQLKDLEHKEDCRKAYIEFALLKARAMNNSNKSKESLNVLYPLLNEAEKNEDTLTQLSAINLILGSYVAVGQDQKALEWGYKALSLFPPVTTLSYARQNNVILSNISLCYLHLYEAGGPRSYLDSADYYTSLAIAGDRKFELINDLAYNLSLKATILGHAKKTAEGEAMLQESLKIYREIGNTFAVINTMSILGNFYIITKQPEKGIAICKEGIELAKNIRPNTYLYGNLAENYKLAGNYLQYGETLKQLLALKDSMYKVNSAEELSSLQTRYEVQKRENIIIRQKLDLTQKNYLLYCSLFLLFLLLVGGYILLAIRKKNQAIKLQQLQIEEKRKMVQAVLQAEENERKRIAADLHDGVAQKMVVAKLNLQTFETYFPGFNMEQRQIFDNISSLVEDSCTEVRDLSHSMMPQAFFSSGLTEAVKNLLNKIGDKKLLIKFSAEGGLDNISDDTQLMIYRIMQECIQNTLKHAEATKLDIAIIAEKETLDITVEDNGVGFDSAGPHPEGVGLKNIRSRVAFLNGHLDVSSRPGDGTLIALYIPLNQTSI